MVIIIMGLYSFLWGKTNEIPKMSQKNVGTGEVSTTINIDSGVAQSTAVVVPCSSPIDSSVFLEIEKTNKC